MDGIATASSGGGLVCSFVMRRIDSCLYTFDVSPYRLTPFTRALMVLKEVGALVFLGWASLIAGSACVASYRKRRNRCCLDVFHEARGLACSNRKFTVPSLDRGMPVVAYLRERSVDTAKAILAARG